jgi:hypothetical protein
VKSVLAAEFAVLVHFKSVGVILLVFLRFIVSLFALCAYESNFDSCIISHFSAPPIKIFLTVSVSVPPSEKAVCLVLSDGAKNRHNKKAHSQRY